MMPRFNKYMGWVTQPGLATQLFLYSSLPYNPASSITSHLPIIPAL